jgi:GTPase
MILTKQKQDQAILVAFSTQLDTSDLLTSLDELERLAQTVSIQTVHKITQHGKVASARTLIGDGKVQEIKQLIENDNIDVVIFDDELSPAQLRNLESDLDVQVFDRSFLILSIFAERAQSKEAVLEVALAQKKYMISRLIGMRASLSRQGGGSYNAKGPGETKLELDRRKVLEDISIIKAQLKKIKTEKETTRKQRKYTQTKTVALVGYTNAGKSSLMNALVKLYGLKEHETLEKDMLFSTIDTKSKRLHFDNQRDFLLIDTVGFISKLPTELVNSFETTLEDVKQADLILHLIDGTDVSTSHIQTTQNILKKIGADHIPTQYVITKADLLRDFPVIDLDYILLSSHSQVGIPQLMTSIFEHLYETFETVTMSIDFNHMNVYHKLKSRYKIISEIYHEFGIDIKVSIDPTHLKPYLSYIKKIVKY